MTLGQRAYEAFLAQRDQDQPISVGWSRWDQLSDRIQKAWEAAAHAVATDVGKEYARMRREG